MCMLIMGQCKVFGRSASTQWLDCMLFYPQRLNGEAEVSCIEERLNSKRNAFARLCEENMEHEQKVEDYKIKLHER